MSEVACFLIEPLLRAKRGLRRYASSGDTSIPACAGRLKYHEAIVWIDTFEILEDAEGLVEYPEGAITVAHFLTDTRWPESCAEPACGYRFRAADEWQIFAETIYRRTDTGEATSLRDAAPGAIWNAKWMLGAASDTWRRNYAGPDGQCLVVRLPNGRDWMIDGIASNCDASCLDCGAPMHQHLANPPTVPCRLLNPRPHKCWIRHGIPPALHVDKNGITCNAGAGSIQAGSYHGFLHNGRLREC